MVHKEIHYLFNRSTPAITTPMLFRPEYVIDQRAFNNKKRLECSTDACCCCTKEMQIEKSMCSGVMSVSRRSGQVRLGRGHHMHIGDTHGAAQPDGTAVPQARSQSFL